MDDGLSPSRFSHEQKTGLLFLLVFAFLAVGLGALQLRNTIYGPFVIRADTGDDTKLALDEDARLQQIDTDHDGINDYEEIHFYNTSAYLPDTDSDGLEDKTEVDRGTDPLCPQGKICSVTIEEQISASSSRFLGGEETFRVDESAGNPLDALAAMGETSATSTLPADLLNNPAALRELLLKSGTITPEQLSKIDDATLLRLAKESIDEGN